MFRDIKKEIKSEESEEITKEKSNLKKIEMASF
jgi:hypothetical protein